MLHRFLLLFGWIYCYSVVGQSHITPSSHYFGDLLYESQRYIDLEVSNKGVKPFSIFSIRKPREVVALISNKIVNPDSTAIVRLQVNPTKKGPFEYEVSIYTSDQNEATLIRLEGNMVEYDPNSNHLFTACPSFNQAAPVKNLQAFDLRVLVVDSLTRLPIPNAEVRLIQKGLQVWKLPTDENGRIKKEARLGLSYFQATHPNYEAAEIGQYINFKRNEIVLAMLKDTTPTEVMTVIENTQLPPASAETSADETETPAETSTTIVDTIVPSFPSLASLATNDFSSTYFKPINVVFILDISSSMRHADRTELMKYALIELAEMLRPEDQVSIVTYASSVEVLLSPTSGADKSVIKEKISNIETGGLTSGGLGIKQGFKTAMEAKLEDGANHVIIITDGSFNQNSGNYKRLIKKHRKKGVTFSVVGIKNKPHAEAEMKEDAQLGGGNFVPIHQLSDAEQNLKQEIRNRTFRF